MSAVPGSSCAEALVRVGLPHDVVVQALVAELDLTTTEAEIAWNGAATSRQDDLAAIRRELRRVYSG